jgi:hypothetical protein
MVTTKQEADPLLALLVRAAAALKAAGDAVAPRVVTIDERPAGPERPPAQVDLMIHQRGEETRALVESLNKIDQRLNKIEMFVTKATEPGEKE